MMTKQEFVKLFNDGIEAKWKAEMQAGRMRPSEFAASLTSLEFSKTAEKIWRKHRAALSTTTREEIIRQINEGKR